MAEPGEGNSWTSRQAITEEELTEYQKLMGDVERREQARIDRLAKEMSDKCSHELTAKVEEVSKDYNTCFEARMKDMSTRYENHATSNISSRQIEVLRLNKIIRDVSRNIGDSWRIVFPRIMAKFPEDVVQAQIAKIERQRPFMQGYKALTTWKELSGDEIQLVPLIEALKACESVDLLERVLDIMDANRDTVLSMGEFKTDLGEETDEDGKAKASLAAHFAGGGITDSNLLKISRKLTDDWQRLGKVLGVPADDIAEIEANEQGYQAAFKVLWTWRDNAREAGDDEEAAGELVAALNKVGKRDLVAIVQEENAVTTA